MFSKKVNRFENKPYFRDMKTHHITYLLLGLCALAACTVTPPENARRLPDAPTIYPDYTGIALPYNIAPLNFSIEEEGEAFIAVASAGDGRRLVEKGRTIRWDLVAWHELLEANKGDSLSIDIYARAEDGSWSQYQTIRNLIAPEPIDPYLTYRLIEPLYVFYEAMSLNQRNLTNFEERVLIANGRPVEEERGRCVNCHVPQNYNRTGNTQFHIRGYKGGTLLATPDGARKVNLKNQRNPSDGVYPAWHPTLPLIVYSTNQTRQHFHSKDPQKVEVMDLASGLILYDTERNTVSPLQDNPDELETFPAWSPDGRSLYYVSARYPEGVPMEKDSLFNRYREFHYDIYRKSFDPKSRTFAAETDTVFRASAIGKSATFPRVSPDGNYLLFTLGDYGTFHIWHRDADLYLMDLRTKEVTPLAAANNPDATDSYHTWSSNGSWVVFSSRRDDGSYTRPYFTYFKEGEASKPFVLPQESPDYYRKLFKSFNVPELMVNPVKASRGELIRAMEGKAIQASAD